MSGLTQSSGAAQPWVATAASNDPEFDDPSTFAPVARIPSPHEPVIGTVIDLDRSAQRRQANFAAWFGNSRVVDRQGRPLLVYHGTPTHGRYSNNRYVRAEQHDKEYPAFETFWTAGCEITDSAWLGAGAYFTPDPGFAQEFGNFLLPGYLKIERPFEIEDDDTTGSHNRFRFLMSLQSLAGLPAAFRLDLSMPATRTTTDPRGQRLTWYYRADEVRYPDGRRHWRILQSFQERSDGGFVEGTGATVEEAVFNYRYRYEFSGFLLHLIGKLGAQKFRALLELNGYDGVIKYRNAYRDEPPGRSIREAVVFQPTQIKSSIGNCGDFDPKDPSILR